MILDFTKLALRYGRTHAKPTTRAKQPSFLSIGSTDNNDPVFWPAARTDDEALHGLILGSSGAGKTALSTSVAARCWIRERQLPPAVRPSRLIVDPKSDVVTTFLEVVAGEAPELLKSPDLIYLNPFQNGGFALNLCHAGLYGVPLEVRALQLAELVGLISSSMTKRTDGGTGARQQDVLLNTFHAALSSEHELATILFAHDALIHPSGLAALARLTSSERARRFLLSTKISDELKSSTASRIRGSFELTDRLASMLSTKGRCIQFDKALAPGKVTFLDLGTPPIESVRSLFANLILRLAADYLIKRPSPWTGHHCRLILDEAHLIVPVLTDIAELILTTGRSRGISLITMSQGTALINRESPELLETILSNCPTKLIGRLAVPDAELITKSIAPQLGSEEPLRVIRDRMFAALTNAPKRRFLHLAPRVREQFTSRTLPVAKWKAAARHHEAAIRELKLRFALGNAPLRPSLGDITALGRKSASSSKRRKSRWG